MKKFIRDIKFFITPVSLLIGLLIYAIMDFSTLIGIIAFVVAAVMMIIASFIENDIKSEIFEDEIL